VLRSKRMSLGNRFETEDAISEKQNSQRELTHVTITLGGIIHRLKLNSSNSEDKEMLLCSIIKILMNVISLQSSPNTSTYKLNVI